MNKIILIFLLLNVNFLFAQTQSTSYTLSDDSFSVTVPFSVALADQFYVLAVDGHLTNNTQNSVSSNWIRTIQYLTTGWSTAVCDPNLCSGDGVNTADFVFQADTTALIHVNFTPNQISGYGIVKVAFRNQGNAFDKVEGTFIGIVDAGNGVSSIEKLKGIKFFPNPANEKYIIAAESSMNPKSIEVFDLLGNRINTTISDEGENLFSINLNNFINGFYFLRIKLSDGSVITRKFTKN